MPKFIVDECTGIPVAQFLRKSGFDVVSVGEDTPQADDFDILQRAVAEQRVIVTNDKDFGDMVYRDGRKHTGILLRLSDDRINTRLQVIAAVIGQHLDKLESHFVVATEKNIRFRLHKI